jgi:hypothetical protein
MDVMQQFTRVSEVQLQGQHRSAGQVGRCTAGVIQRRARAATTQRTWVDGFQRRADTAF